MWQRRPMWLAPERATELHARSMNQPDYVFAKLWDSSPILGTANSHCARVSAAITDATRSGVDRVTVRMALAQGGEALVKENRTQLRAGTYRPKTVRRVLIPKAGTTGKFEPGYSPRCKTGSYKQP